MLLHDDVIKWRHSPRYWPFVRGIHRSPVNSPHKGQWRGALMFSLTWAWTNSWANNGDAGDLRRHRAHYDVIVMGMLLCGRQEPIHFAYSIIFMLIQCGTVITRSIFSQNSQKTPHSSTVRSGYGVSFVDPASDWYSASVPVIIYVIHYNIGPRYNGTRLWQGDDTMNWSSSNISPYFDQVWVEVVHCELMPFQEVQPLFVSYHPCIDWHSKLLGKITTDQGGLGRFKGNLSTRWLLVWFLSHSSVKRRSFFYFSVIIW